MSTFFQFIKSRLFLFNLLGSAILVVITLVFAYRWLNSFTLHGSSLSVPDLRGMQMRQVDEFLATKNLRFKISDSTIFDPGRPPGTVVGQDPHPNEKVKENRTIYLSITRTTPPGVKIPDLEDNSLKQAEAILISYGLVRGQLIYQPDLARNAVLEMQINGVRVMKGMEVPKGTMVDLVLGDGFGITKVPVPDLYGLQLDEALFAIQASSLNLGSLIFDSSVRDSTQAKVYKQLPASGDSALMSQGEPMDLFLTQSQSVLDLHETKSNIDENNEP